MRSWWEPVTETWEDILRPEAEDGEFAKRGQDGVGCPLVYYWLLLTSNKSI